MIVDRIALKKRLDRATARLETPIAAVDLAAFLSRLVEGTRPRAETKGIRLALDPGSPRTIPADAHLLTRAIRRARSLREPASPPRQTVDKLPGYFDFDVGAAVEVIGSAAAVQGVVAEAPEQSRIAGARLQGVIAGRPAGRRGGKKSSICRPTIRPARNIAMIAITRML